MSDLPLLTWVLVLAALVLGILAGHFGWGKRWPGTLSKLHPDYLTGLDYLVTEQPDRALDMFLKLMDANADTIETHFALGSLYRRRGEVERAIRIHQNLLAREALAPEHREQALLALAQDYLARRLARSRRRFVSAGQRGAAAARQRARCAARRVRAAARLAAGARRLSATGAHQGGAAARGRGALLCELASACHRARRYRRMRGGCCAKRARRRTPFPRAALLRAQIAERDAQPELAVRLLRQALIESPELLQDELPHLLKLVEPRRARCSADRTGGTGRVARFRRIEAPGVRRDRRRIWSARSRCARRSKRCSRRTRHLQAVWQAGPAQYERMAHEIGALLAQAEKYRCNECGFSGRSFYWHCPACHSWDSFEAYAIVKLR